MSHLFSRLALYVYEYLLHVGAQKSAQTFLSESAAAAPSPVLGNMPPGDGMPVGPVPPGFFQPFMSPRYPGGPRPPLRIPNQRKVAAPRFTPDRKEASGEPGAGLSSGLDLAVLTSHLQIEMH
ncbi:Single-stranded DNA-binding protein 2 [Microtus ochrogaster]|uniref:Single-stranded DNA-binding protein 2 n=1 Tax=Microtus ochrogaster TaxID=79684 RepID=A0A8J6KPT1_MICOH|nr:Single-stranded DNA-binding protein 2 [Microtus ochrogaster]